MPHRRIRDRPHPVTRYPLFLRSAAGVRSMIATPWPNYLWLSGEDADSPAKAGGGRGTRGARKGNRKHRPACMMVKVFEGCVSPPGVTRKGGKPGEK